MSPRFRSIGLAVVFTSWIPGLAAQDPAQEADHQLLRALKSAYEEAVNSDKIELLAPHMDAQFSGVMLTNSRVESLKDMQDYWARIKEMMGTGGKYIVKLNPDLSLLLGDVALAKGTSEDRVVTGAGKEYTFGSSWTAVLRKVGGQWKILRVQGCMDPIGNPFVSAGLKATTISASVAAGLIGLLLGYLLRIVTGRKRSAA